MISFGELRRLSVQWHTEIAAVERAYALDWLLKGLFDREFLQASVALRGASALSKVYFANYPQVQDLDFARGVSLDDATFQRELEQAGHDAQRASGLTFTLHSIAGTEARFEYTGPLGRRSAAQPRIPLRFVPLSLRADPAQRPLLHPFSDRCDVILTAMALEEIAAEHIARFSGKPRARDVFDLWFILTRGIDLLNPTLTRELSKQIADEKHLPLRHSLDATYRPLLERSWDNVLKGIPHPPLPQAESEVNAKLGEFLLT